MTLKNREVEGVVRRIKDLPTLPARVLQVTRIVNDPQAAARDLAAVITDDQILTARLLRLVNSSFYGFPQRISTVTGAIVLLGFDAIRNLLLSTSVFNLFRSGTRELRFRLESFWDHALGCALASKAIGRRLRQEQLEELFVAGLLHDIGKIVEMLYFAGGFARVSLSAAREKVLMVEAEREEWGYTHAEIGAALAEVWRLPPKLIQVIGLHHRPDEAGSFAVETAIVHLGDILSRALNLGSGGDRRIPRLNDTAWRVLELEVDALESIMDETLGGFHEVRSVMGLRV